VVEGLPEILMEAIEKTLQEYTNFLCKKGYTDADVYVEEPKALDQFLSTSKV